MSQSAARSAARSLTTTFLLTCLLGCGGGSSDEWSSKRPKTFPVSGQVLYQGLPVADAMVSLTSIGGATAVGAAGRTDKDGRFRLSTYGAEDGAVAGTHQVSVIKAVVEGEDPSYFDENSPNYGKEPPPTTTRHLVPEKYSRFETSGLTATIEASGDNELKLELVD